MLSDAPLLFPPGQLALAAVRSGLRKVQFWLVLVLLGEFQCSGSCIEHIGSAAYGPICSAGDATSQCTAVRYRVCTTHRGDLSMLQAQISSAGYVARAAEQASLRTGVGSTAQLEMALSAIDQHGTQGAQSVDEKDVSAKRLCPPAGPPFLHFANLQPAAITVPVMSATPAVQRLPGLLEPPGA